MARELTHLERLDQISRVRWRRAAASVLILTLGQAGAKEVVARGFDPFLAHARKAYEGHAFKYDDFKEIFELLRLASEGKATARSVLV